MAAVKGHSGVVRYLATQGAGFEKLGRDVAVNSMGFIPEGPASLLSLIASMGLVETVRVLLELGADRSVASGAGGLTPLGWAVYEGHMPMIKILVETGGVRLHHPARLGSLGGKHRSSPVSASKRCRKR